jgi:hypothetical protein
MLNFSVCCEELYVRDVSCIEFCCKLVASLKFIAIKFPSIYLFTSLYL